MTRKEMFSKLGEILHLDTGPVAVKFYKDRNELKRRTVHFKLNFCQMVSMARYQGRVSAQTADNMICAMGACCLGLIKTTESFESGEAAVGPYVKDHEAGRRFMANTYKLGDKGKQFDAVVVGPLGSLTEEPDVVTLYANPAQMMRLVHANTYDTGEKITADTVAEAALCSSIGFAFGENKAILGLPCAGDRIFGGTQKDEMVFSMPFSMTEKIIKNLEKTAKGGFSVYPIPPNMTWTPSMPKTYTIQPEDLK